MFKSQPAPMIRIFFIGWATLNALFVSSVYLFGGAAILAWAVGMAAAWLFIVIFVGYILVSDR